MPKLSEEVNKYFLNLPLFMNLFINIFAFNPTSWLLLARIGKRFLATVSPWLTRYPTSTLVSRSSASA